MKGISAAYGFFGAFLGGTGLGFLVDRWLGTGPWAMLAGTVLGFVGGLYTLYKALVKQE